MAIATGYRRAEQEGLPARERFALRSAIEKLGTVGDQLGFPHSSSIERGLRELRPRQGRGPWRAFYARVADVIVILAIGPEAQQDRRGFERAVRCADERLRSIKEE
jgi:hypothetical protein